MKQSVLRLCKLGRDVARAQGVYVARAQDNVSRIGENEEEGEQEEEDGEQEENK